MKSRNVFFPIVRLFENNLEFRNFTFFLSRGSKQLGQIKNILKFINNSRKNHKNIKFIWIVCVCDSFDDHFN